MNIYDYADAINVDLVVRRYAAQGNRWIACFEHGEVKEGPCLASEYGTGSNAEAAIEDYVLKIRGKRTER